MPRRAALLGAFVATAVYVMVIGAPPPALRSAAMLGVAMASRLAQRPTSPWAAWAIGAFVPLLVPRTALDVGYQLSVLGMCALVAAGYHVVEAAHSGHALLASLRGGAIDIILTELSMGDISGPNLAERVRRHHPALRAAYFANSGTPECDSVIVRPFTRDDLLSRLPGLRVSVGA